MKTIKSRFLRFISVIYYNFYLIRKPIGNDVNSFPSLVAYSAIYCAGTLVAILSIINNEDLFVALSLISVLPIYFIVYKILTMTMGDFEMRMKIIKKKPKFFNSQVLSMIITILFILGSVLIPYLSYRLVNELKAMWI